MKMNISELLTVALLGVLVAGCSRRLGPYDYYDLRGIWKGYMVFNDAPKDTIHIQMEITEQHISYWEGIHIGAIGTFTFFMPDGSLASYPLGSNDIGKSDRFYLEIITEEISKLHFLKGYIFYGSVNNKEITGTYRYFEKRGKDGKDPLHLYEREGTWYASRQ